MSYTPWGEIANHTGALPPSFGFQSSYTDPSTGLIDMGARWYRPASGGFSSRDFTPVGGEERARADTQYSYGSTDPLDHYDPDGHNARFINASTGGAGPSVPWPIGADGRYLGTSCSGQGARVVVTNMVARRKGSTAWQDASLRCGNSGYGVKHIIKGNHFGANKLGGKLSPLALTWIREAVRKTVLKPAVRATSNDYYLSEDEWSCVSLHPTRVLFSIRILVVYEFSYRGIVTAYVVGDSFRDGQLPEEIDRDCKARR
jgi:RHS repeat-associated protein